MTTMVCFVGRRLISDLVNNEGDHFFLRLVCIDFTINNFSVDSNEFVPDSAGSTKSRAEFHEDCRIWFVIQMFHRGKELLTKFCFFSWRDSVHEKSHTRPMCKRLMNPDHGSNKEVMQDINTSVCEQFFSYLTKFRCSLRGYNYPYSTLFTFLLFHLKNCHTVGIDPNATGLGRTNFSSHIKRHYISQYIFESIHNDSKPTLIGHDIATNDEVGSVDDDDDDDDAIMATDHLNSDDEDLNLQYDD